MKTFLSRSSSFVLITLSLLLSGCFLTEETPISVRTKYYDSGLKQVHSTYKDNVETIEIYYPNGNLKQVTPLINNKITGVIKYYDEDGTLRVEETYVNNGQNGITRRYYKTGELRSEGEYYRMQRHGYERHYYRNGQIDREANFVHGQRKGKRIFYDINGNVEQREFIERTGPRVYKAE